MKAFMLGTMYWLNPKFGEAEIERDVIRIKENRFGLIRSFLWWEKIERTKGEYDFRQSDILHRMATKHGLKIMETFGLYLPLWLAAELAEQGIDDSNRRYPCFDRPEVLAPMRQFLETAVRRYRDSEALAIWNLQNEPGKPPCRCDHTLAKFVEFLRQRYPDLSSLREAWLGECQVFDTVFPESIEALDLNFVKRAFQFGTRGRRTPLEYDFCEFAVENLNDNLRWIGSVVRSIDPVHEHHANPCTPVGNGVYSGVDEWKMADVLDSISVSVHPSHFFFRIETKENFPTAFTFSAEEIRCQAGPRDAWIGELQAGSTFYHPNKYTPSPEELKHHLYQSFGRGLRGVIFWEWQSWRSSMMEVGEFGLRRCQDGGPTDRSAAVAEVGAVLQELRDEFAMLKRPAVRVAIVVSMATKIYKYLQGTEKPWAGNIENDHNNAVYGCFKALHRANIPVDFVPVEQVQTGILANYRTAFLPHIEVMDNATAAGLENFVRDGGWLWADGRCAFLDAHIFLREEIPGHGLSRVFGCEEADFIAIREHHRFLLAGGGELKPFLFLQKLALTTGETVAECDGASVAVRNRYGHGCAELFGTYLTRSLQSSPEESAMQIPVDFVKASGVSVRDDITPGFEFCMLESDQMEVYVMTNRTGERKRLTFSLKSAFASVECPQGGAHLIGNVIHREFSVLETVIFICRRAK